MLPSLSSASIEMATSLLVGFMITVSCSENAQCILSCTDTYISFGKCNSL